jgi:hypothetical protein
VSLPLLQEEARKEAAREADKPMRKISFKLRHEAAVKAIASAFDVFGYEP